MKSRRKHGFQFMTILYFMIVFSMCVSRFNVIMTIMGGQLTRVEEINLLPFHSVRENLQYGRNPISWDMLYNMVMFVPFGIIYCYYQKHFRVYKAVGMSCLTTFFIESAQFILKTGVVDIDDFDNKSYKRRIRRICKQILLKRPLVSAQSAYGPHCMDGLAGLLFSMPSA